VASGGSIEATTSDGAGWQRRQKQRRRKKKNDGVLGLIKESPVLLEGARGRGGDHWHY
jgi:hypothetical protein